MPDRLPNSVFRSQNRAHRSNTTSLLKSGFLDTLGTNKSSLITIDKNRFANKNVEWSSLEDVLIKYGELFVTGFTKSIIEADAVASGVGIDSIRYEFTKMGSTYESVFYMKDYLKFVDEGVQGIKSNLKAPESPYKFKVPYPSREHVQKLEAWIKEKNVTAIITVPKGISQTTKNNSLAYAIGRSIKSKGLRATHFKRKTIERLIDDFKAEVALAASDDIKINILF